MKIREMELLIRVVESGSMTQAAHQLGITPAAVSAAVQRIESQLGLRLFDRTTHALDLESVIASVTDEVGQQEVLDAIEVFLANRR